MCYTSVMTDETAPKPWEQQPDEPPEWYERFHVYLNLGSSRSLSAAFRAWAGSTGKHSGAVSNVSKEWNWKERALAYDQANREEKAAFEAAREAEARERRLRRLEKIIEDSAAALDVADLKNLTQQEARALLPSLRLLFSSAVELQRRELQSAPASDHLPAASGWPELDPEIEKILDMYADEELADSE